MMMKMKTIITKNNNNSDIKKNIYKIAMFITMIIIRAIIHTVKKSSSL